MKRVSRILLSQLRNLSLPELFELLRRNIYYRDPILIYMLDVNDPCLEQHAALDGFVIEKGDIADLDRMKERLDPLPWEFQCYQFDNVEDFFVAKNHEGIQHISWIYCHKDRNRILSLRENEAEVKFCLTLPTARGLGIYPRVINSIVRFLYRKGITRIFMCVHEENHPSIRGIEKAGFHRVGKIHLSKILGTQVSKRFDTSEV